MNTVDQGWRLREVFDVSAHEGFQWEKGAHPSVFVDLGYELLSYPGGGSVEVELFGKEIKELLRGHKFLFKRAVNDDGVRRF
jgi:hypothetical protein